MSGGLNLKTILRPVMTKERKDQITVDVQIVVRCSDQIVRKICVVEKK
jgi:hypothetical protein